jgi:hypothetical protein
MGNWKIKSPIKTVSASTAKSKFRFDFVWWRRSVICAVTIGLVEVLVLFVIALFGDIEFAVLGAYFVAAATVAALPTTALLIVAWQVIIWLMPVVANRRIWLLVFSLIVSFPLYFAPVSFYEFALSAPTLLGFLPQSIRTGPSD